VTLLFNWVSFEGFQPFIVQSGKPVVSPQVFDPILPHCTAVFSRVAGNRFGPKNPQQQRFSLRTKSPTGQHVPTVPKTATHLADSEAESVVWLITTGMSMVLSKLIISPLYK